MIYVLYVDDDASCRELVRMQLENYGIKVETVETAMKAIIKLGVPLWDFVIIDYHLKSYTGIEVEKTVKRRHLPYCYYTGYDKQDVQRATNTEAPIFEKGREVTNNLKDMSDYILKSIKREMEHAVA